MQGEGGMISEDVGVCMITPPLLCLPRHLDSEKSDGGGMEGGAEEGLRRDFQGHSNPVLCSSQHKTAQ